MILNRDELEQAVRKQPGGNEAFRFNVEASLQRATGPESEGLLIVTAKKLFFAHRPPFGEPEVVAFDRAGLAVVDKREDIWGASIKLKGGENPFELRKINPSDFKPLYADLMGQAPAQTQQAAPPPVQQERSAFLGTLTAPASTGPIPQREYTGSSPANLPPTFIPDAQPVKDSAGKYDFQVTEQAKCYVHSGVPATSKCDQCGKSICADCAHPLQFKTYCNNCYNDSKQKVEAMKVRQREVSKTHVDDTRKVQPPPPPVSREDTLRRIVAAGGVPMARSPALAFLLGFMPGFGQFYNKQYGKGLIVMLTSGLVIPWIWGFFDAVNEAKKHNSTLGLAVEPAGCFSFLLVLAPIAVILALLIYIGSEITPKNKSKLVMSPGYDVSQENLPTQRAKIQLILGKYYHLQKDYFEQNKKFMTDIPEEVKKDNDTSFHLEVVMLGKKLDDYRFYAWASTEGGKHLDLWSIGSSGEIAHEYGPESKQPEK